MSIAAISQSFVTTVRAAASAPTEPVRATPRTGREQGRRHELVGAMTDALGLTGEQTRAESQAVFRFAQTLMHDLRALDGGVQAGQKGQGRAWGQRDWGDLAQRLTALAAATSKPGDVAMATPPGVAAAAPTDLPAPAPEPLPETPSPLTPTTAAVYIMKVPTSQLMAAYLSMQQALGVQEPAGSTDARNGLAALATKLAAALAPDAKATLPAGSVLNVSA